MSPTPWNIVYNTFFKSGVIDNAPEKSLIERVIGERGEVKRPVTVGVTDASAGEYKTIDLDKLDDL